MALEWTTDNISKIHSGEIKATSPTPAPAPTVTKSAPSDGSSYQRKDNGGMIAGGFVPDWMGSMTNSDGTEVGRGGEYSYNVDPRPKLDPNLYPNATSKAWAGSGENNNNYFEGGGYAYIDKYGMSHVTSNPNDALEFSGDGKVYNYGGGFSGGYAVNQDGARQYLNLPGSKPYGNDLRDGITPEQINFDPATMTQFNFSSKDQSLSNNAMSSDASADAIRRYSDAAMQAYKEANPDKIAAIERALGNGNTTIDGQVKDASTGVATQPNQEVPAWQNQLEIYKTDRQAGLDEIARAGEVYNAKKAAGDVAGAEAAHRWAMQIRAAMGIEGDGRGTGTAGPAGTAGPEGTAGLDPNSNIMLNLADAKRAFIEEQTAAIEEAKNQKIMELQQALNTAVADGEISVNDAKADFNAKKKEIEKQAYLQSENIKVNAEERGIGNSQQLLGLEQGNANNTMNLNNANMTARDKTISDIKTRLSALKTNMNLSIADANSDAALQIKGAEATANLNYSNNMFDLNKIQYTTDLEKKSAMEQAVQQSKLRIQEMIEGGKIDAAQAEIDFANDMKKIATQHGYSLSEIYASASRSGSGSGGGGDDYALFQNREWKKYNDPDSVEYKLRVSQEDAAMDLNSKQTKQAAEDKMDAELAAKPPAYPGAMPMPTIFNTKTYNQDVADWVAKSAKYQRWLDNNKVPEEVR